jgi:predicted ATPase/DNA-binding CsgD family transcriptional regulator
MELLEIEAQLDRLAAFQEKASKGRGCFVLVSGEAGIGKSSLVKEYTRQLNPKIRLLWGSCDSLSTPRPLGPLYDIASASIPTLLAQLDQGSDWLKIARSFLKDVMPGETVVVIEDVHWADTATLDLLTYLGKRIEQSKMMIILTYRDDELNPQHPLRIMLGDLATTGILRRLPLQGLSVGAVHHLADGKDYDPDELYRLTNGNPFFITELLASPHDGVIPTTIREAVLARAARLSQPARAVLEAAAVIGFRVEPWLLVDISQAEAAAIEECMAVGVLQAAGDMLAFRHQLARQVILEALSPSKKLDFHRLALHNLANSPITKHDKSRLAHHAEGAIDQEAVLKYAPEAAQAAASVNSHREAAAQYARALRFAGSLSKREKARLLEQFGDESTIIDEAEPAIQAYREAVKLREELGDRENQSKILCNLARCLVRAGKNAESEESSRAAIDVLSNLPPSPQLAAAYQTQAALRMLNRDIDEAITLGRKALSMAEQFNDIPTLANAYNVVGSSMMVSDKDEGKKYLEKSLSLAQAAELPSIIALGYTNLSSAGFEVYNFPLADHYLEKGIAYCKELELLQNLYYMLAWQAVSHLYQGRWNEAAETATIVINRSQSAVTGRIIALVVLGRLRARRGDPGVFDVLDEAKDLALKTETLQRLAPVHAARAEAAWLSGKLSGFLKEIDPVYDLAVQKKHAWFTGELAYWRWRAGEKISLPSWTAAPFALLIEGNWKKASAEWERLLCPYEQAWALSEGDEKAQLKALSIFEDLGAVPAKEILQRRLISAGVRGIPRGPKSATRQNPFGLTPRQFETLTLLAKGMNNNQIAEELFISPRTVEHHIAAIFKKLEVDSRPEAVALAWEHNLIVK